MSTRRLVYSRLYHLRIEDRLYRAWQVQLQFQLITMRRALSFMLTPCVEHIMSFLALDDSIVYVYLLLQTRHFDIGIPTIRSVIISFLDDRLQIQRDLRAAVMNYFWDVYVGRPSDFIGDIMHWRRVCQEISDYQFAHTRCLRENVRVSRFREQLDSLTEQGSDFE